jgi:outer membrane protein assembly factor BamB
MRLIAVIALVLSSLEAVAGAQEWPQWRGPSRNGVVSDGLREWPKAFQPGWRVEVGEGYSSPVMAEGRIFIHSRKDPAEVVTAIEASSGKKLWSQTYAAPFTKNQYADKMAKGPYATPYVGGGMLYTFGGTGILTAWKVESGVLVWKKDFSTLVENTKMFCGTSASPLLESGKLIVQVGSDVHKGKVIAFDPSTGQELWTWDGPGPGYASPIALTAGGVRQIASMTESSIVGIEAATGKHLWSIAFPDEWQENIVTPTWTGSLLIVSGTRQGTHAYALKNAGGAWTTSEAWKNTATNMYMSSPVYADGILYGFSNKKRGHLFALDAATGEVKWATDGREGDNASVLMTSMSIVYLTNSGKLNVVAKNGTKLEPQRTYALTEGESWPVPILLPDGIVIKDATAVTMLKSGTASANR